MVLVGVHIRTRGKTVLVRVPQVALVGEQCAEATTVRTALVAQVVQYISDRRVPVRFAQTLAIVIRRIVASKQDASYWMALRDETMPSLLRFWSEQVGIDLRVAAHTATAEEALIQTETSPERRDRLRAEQKRERGRVEGTPTHKDLLTEPDPEAGLKRAIAGLILHDAKRP